MQHDAVATIKRMNQDLPSRSGELDFEDRWQAYWRSDCCGGNGRHGGDWLVDWSKNRSGLPVDRARHGRDSFDDRLSVFLQCRAFVFEHVAAKFSGLANHRLSELCAGVYGDRSFLSSC